MKKYTYFLVLFSIMFFVQLQASIYPNYSQTIGVSSLNNSAQSGTGGGTISINNDILTISISANWYSSLYIKIGTVVALTVSPSIPDMELGPVLSLNGGSTGVYLAKIVNNSLVFYLTYAPTSQTGCSLNFTKNLACITVPIWYADNDLDGLGDPLNSLTQCTQPDGNYVLDNTDNCPLLPGTNASCTDLAVSLQNQNYIKNTTYKVATATSITAPTITQASQNITYIDGLGRPMQSIGIKQSGITGKDIITHIDYDAFGRQAKDYLPYVPLLAGDEGSYRPDAFGSTNSFYDAANYEADFPGMTTLTINPYSEKLFEASPLNRVLFQGAPGQAWKAANTYYDHAIQFQYQTNTATEVKKYVVSLLLTNYTYTPTLFLAGNYNGGELFKSITYDENHTYGSGLNHTTEEFKNKQGQVVLKRTYNASVAHDTYYVYDDYGNLTYVIPPLASEQLFSGDTSEPYNISFPQSAFTGTSDGNGTVQVSITVNQIAVTFNATFYPNILNGTPQLINSPCVLPDMYLGQLQTTPSSPISASIENGYLKLTNTYNIAISGFNCVLTKTLSSGCGGPTLNTDVLNELCYQYKYDSRNRLVEKKIPGKQWEFIVYDKLDRPIATGPAFSPFTSPTGNGWLITKYDAFDRPVISAWLPSTTVTSAGRKTLQDARNAELTNFSETKIATTSDTTINGVAFRYTNAVYPVSGYHVLSVNYFDDYNFPNAPTIPSEVELQTVFYNTTVKPKGLSTGTWTRVLETSTLYRNEVAYTLYDYKARPIRSYSQNYLGGYTYVDSKLDFTGKPEYTLTKHKLLSTSTELTTKEEFVYSEQGRLLTQTHQINIGAKQLIAKNDYDELGQLISKKVGGADITGVTGLQTVNYAYNIRGWLKQINDPNILGTDLFGFKINYNTASHGATPLYNGNISETEWKTQNDNVLRWYNYSYDALNRITKGISSDSKFDLGATTNPVTYDKNGNILSLYRKGAIVTNPVIGTSANYGVMDQLTYTYQANSNKLTIVSDAGNDTFGFKDDQIGTGTDITVDYTYDANGNMLKDLNKAMTSNILYNHLNLPTKVTFASGNIAYIYDATGVKLEKVVTEGTAITQTKYAGNFIYEKIGTAADALKFFSTAEGYVEPNGGTGYNYVYQYKDHLGNIRLSYKDISLTSTPSLQIVEENNYYPFGLKHKGYNTNIISEHKYKYNGKELQDELGLNVYDMEARNYMPDIGRWGVIDELADNFDDLSPYNFSNNNPISFSDPNGMASERFNNITSTVVNKKGEIIDYKPDGDDNIYLNERSTENIIGKEREGVVYNVGNYLTSDDLNVDANLPLQFKIKLTNDINIQNDFYFWPSEIMSGGALIKIGNYAKYLQALYKYKKLVKNSKFLQQIVKQLEKDGEKSITKTYKKLLRRTQEHKSKLPDLEYKSSVEREIRAWEKNIEELEIFMRKHKIKL